MTAHGVSHRVKKPLFGREGGGVSLMDRGNCIVQGADGQPGEPLVYQKCANLFTAGRKHFVWGLWMGG